MTAANQFRIFIMGGHCSPVIFRVLESTAAIRRDCRDGHVINLMTAARDSPAGAQCAPLQIRFPFDSSKRQRVKPIHTANLFRRPAVGVRQCGRAAPSSKLAGLTAGPPRRSFGDGGEPFAEARSRSRANRSPARGVRPRRITSGGSPRIF